MANLKEWDGEGMSFFPPPGPGPVKVVDSDHFEAFTEEQEEVFALLRDLTYLVDRFDFTDDNAVKVMREVRTQLMATNEYLAGRPGCA